MFWNMLASSHWMNGTSLQLLAFKVMNFQQCCYWQNNIFVAFNTQNFIAVLKVEIPFYFRPHIVNMRPEFSNLLNCFYRCFKNKDHFFDNVANRFSRLVMLAVNPSLKPISIILSKRASDSL